MKRLRQWFKNKLDYLRWYITDETRHTEVCLYADGHLCSMRRDNVRGCIRRECITLTDDERNFKNEKRY